jgi:hypothetical protein
MNGGGTRASAAAATPNLQIFEAENCHLAQRDKRISNPAGGKNKSFAAPPRAARQKDKTIRRVEKKKPRRIAPAGLF